MATTIDPAALRAGKGPELYRKAKTMIPGGTGLFGHRQELHAPEQWPTYFAEAKGSEVVDLDGNRFIDFASCGIGATALGYADPDVVQAVTNRVANGSMCMLNPPDEVELAELLLQLHPWASKVRFGRLGGETMAIAVRIARAHTGRDHIAFCGYHGWHDWYISANLPTDDDDRGSDRLGNWHLMPGLEPKGVPAGLAGTTMPFTYNKIDELKAIIDSHGDRLAAIVMEPTRNLFPEPGFLEGVRELATQCGACLVFDEITISWKLTCGGAHLKYGIEPDMAVFAKSLANGVPMGAIVGRTEPMDAFQDTFCSSAFWSEGIGPAAALAAVKKHMRLDVPAHLDHIGNAVRAGLRELAAKYDMPLAFSGHPCLQYFGFDHPEAAALQTLWTVRMLTHGLLITGSFYPMWTHTDAHVDTYLEACDEVFAELADAIAANDIESRIGGPVKITGLRRLA
ncbi:MAG: aminotransferase class III-fold pyridoxal phosphate-dependent enzyme [Lentisphaeria bacterium]|jgi:glutamate-1-semialdehyde 2,1-aminomutase|nr:aminotransferase class III-fold pyridoxal phosphate-dependent enzyme [Lentisphaeria bacterium]MDP7743092.1 aminotransferase class III-fold pyridoxal phosphate-dependent enzyme [Lentisphaeria bacterium]